MQTIQKHVVLGLFVVIAIFFFSFQVTENPKQRTKLTDNTIHDSKGRVERIKELVLNLTKEETKETVLFDQDEVVEDILHNVQSEIQTETGSDPGLQIESETSTSISTVHDSSTLTETENLIQPKEPDIYNRALGEEPRPIEEYVNEIILRIKHRQGEQLLPTCTKPKNNFVYLKNHKCASDTMAAVFRRFGYTRNLSLVQPVGMRWNIGWPHWLEPHMYRPGHTGTFNILTEHTVYNETYMHKIMEPDSVYISSIRKPFAHLKSAFYYFRMPAVRSYVNMAPGEDVIMSFLKDKDGWNDKYMDPDTKIKRPCIPLHFSVARNMMSFDLGFPTGFHLGYPSQEQNITYITEWLEHLDAKYDMVRFISISL